MEFIFSSDCLLHDTGSHPECAERLDAFRGLPNTTTPPGESFLKLVHTSDHIEKIKQSCTLSIPVDNDTLTCPNSYLAACAAVGASITAANTGGFALVRPPGHHAYPQRASGFCLFNNIAIATHHLINEGKKVFILDIDGHLGDGTSHIFYQDPRVLYCSLHQFPAFPGNGWVDEVGSGPGQGFTVNIPMPPGAADDIYWKGLDFILPLARQFDPDVVAISAGFDAQQLDPLLQLRLSLDCYYQSGQWLRNHFKEVFAILEGGYNLDILPKAIHQFRDGFNGTPQKYPENTTTSNTEVTAIFDRNLSQLHKILKPYWPI